MKTSKDPRHIERIKLMQELFSVEFRKADLKNTISSNQPISRLADSLNLSAISQEIVENKGRIDKLIEEAAPSWPVNKINKVDLAVLRLAVYELFYAKKAPTKVIVDEAVELAKEYGSEASGGFVNGVLGTLIDKYPVDVA